MKNWLSLKQRKEKALEGTAPHKGPGKIRLTGRSGNSWQREELQIV